MTQAGVAQLAGGNGLKNREETRVGSNPTAGTKRDVAELADATVLGAVVARRVGSSPTISTITGRGGIGTRIGLKTRLRKDCGFESHRPDQTVTRTA